MVMEVSEEYNAPISWKTTKTYVPWKRGQTTLQATLCNNSDNDSIQFPNFSHYSHICFTFLCYCSSL